MAYVNGCHIVSTLCADNPEGFSSTVSRTVAGSDGKPVEIVRGPFKTVYAAQKYAHSWSEANAQTPPDVPNPEPVDPMSVPPEEKPVENPPAKAEPIVASAEPTTNESQIKE